MSQQPDSALIAGSARTARAWRLRVAAGWALVLVIATPGVSHAATERDALLPKSDMAITATASAGFASGFNATYTLTLTNNGPQSAAGPITVTDTLPAGLTYTSGTGAGWTCAAAGQIVTCTWPGAFAKNLVSTISIVAFITGAVATSVTNIATVTYPLNDDTDLTNNRATTTSAVTVRNVATTPDGATITRLPSNGTTYSQTFVLSNTGNISDSYSLVASVAPAGIVTIVSVNGAPGSTNTSAPIAVGATGNVAVVYTVATGAPTGAVATLTLTATSIVTGTSANTGTLVVTVGRAGIAMAKLLYRDDQTTLVNGAAKVSAGEFVQYRVTVTSTGVAAAASVIVADVIPAQVTYNTATGDVPGWSFGLAGSTLTANLAGTLAPSTSRYFWIRVQVK